MRYPKDLCHSLALLAKADSLSPISSGEWKLCLNSNHSVSFGNSQRESMILISSRLSMLCYFSVQSYKISPIFLPFYRKKSFIVQDFSPPKTTFTISTSPFPIFHFVKDRERKRLIFYGKAEVDVLQYPMTGRIFQLHVSYIRIYVDNHKVITKRIRDFTLAVT